MRRSIFKLFRLLNEAHLLEAKTSKTLSYKEYLFPDIFISASQSQKEVTSFPKTVSHNKSNEKQQNRKLHGKNLFITCAKSMRNYQVWENIFLCFPEIRL